MKFSNNTIILDNYPQNGEYLLFNTRTQAMVKIHEDFLFCSIGQIDGPQGWGFIEWIFTFDYTGELIQTKYERT